MTLVTEQPINTVAIDKVGQILKQVASWPTVSRLDSGQKTLETIAKEFPVTTRKGVLTESLLGILKLDGIPPTDAGFQCMIEDELIRQHVGMPISRC